jgi:hypothetical protein
MAKVKKQALEHLSDRTERSREFWIDSLGLPAVLPQPGNGP